MAQNCLRWSLCGFMALGFWSSARWIRSVGSRVQSFRVDPLDKKKDRGSLPKKTHEIWDGQG